MFLVGADSTKFPDAAGRGAAWLLDAATAEKLDGIYFRSVLELSPKLDAGELREVAAEARTRGLRLEAGVGKVNPFSTPEAPAIRALGGGDYRAAIQRMVSAAAEAGIHELWTALCNYQFDLAAHGIYAFDRFRTDVTWEEQLAATTRFLATLAPMLRDYGTHLNIETHEEITTFELVRIVEDVGPDVIGITFDTANVLVRGEEPVAAASRVSPYLRATHVRDAALLEAPQGLARLLMPVGHGVIDWPALLDTLAAQLPAGLDVMLSIEGILRSRAEMVIPFRDPRWRQGHPDLTAEELAAIRVLADGYAQRAEAGLAPDAAALRAPVAAGDPLEFLRQSATALRSLVANCATTPVPIPN